MTRIVQRPRRLRRTSGLRRMVQETRLSPDNFIQPLFVSETATEAEPIASLPGIMRQPIRGMAREAKAVFDAGVPAVMLFGVPAKKDEKASQAYAKDGVVQRAIIEVKSAVPELQVITDVCLCEYMSHGHCGVVEGAEILNDPSLRLLAQTALSHAEAGADIVAPSDMMDGRVSAIRHMLDENEFPQLPILSYAVKYASAFYGPFREAADSTPSFGDRTTYQMDPANLREALREAQLDVDEGADILMVKPAMSYLDILFALRESFEVPLAAYQVSGEYAMLKAAAERSWVDEKRAVVEALTSIKRAGADLIVSYYAKQAAHWLNA